MPSCSSVAEPHSERRITFDRLHADGADPWAVETSTYEHEKRQQTVATLGSGRFNRALEVGCSIGKLAEALATSCDALLALDVSQTALARARERLREQVHVTFERREIPADWPPGRFDLIVFSEVLYFLSPDEIQCTSIAAQRALATSGRCVLVNWTGENNLPVNGKQAVEIFTKGSKWRGVETKEQPLYRLDIFGL